MAEMLNPALKKPLQSSGAAISDELVLISSRISAGDLNEAKSRLLDIVSRATNDLATLIALGQVARRLGDNALALAQYRAAASAHPDNVWPRAELALFLRELGYNAEAEETLHACLSNLGCSLSLRSKLLVPLGCLLVERGERAAAIRCFSKQCH
jgi:tetratricopeptide (TPR) repeat protein